MLAGVAITCLTSHYSGVSYQDILPSSTRVPCHFRLCQNKTVMAVMPNIKSSRMSPVTSGWHWSGFALGWHERKTEGIAGIIRVRPLGNTKFHCGPLNRMVGPKDWLHYPQSHTANRSDIRSQIRILFFFCSNQWRRLGMKLTQLWNLHQDNCPVTEIKSFHIASCTGLYCCGKFGHLQSVYFIIDNCTTAAASWYLISSLPYSQMYIY